MSGIFVSYRREDSAGYAGRLYDRLSAYFGGGRVFMDVAAIEAGEDFTRAIERNLASCKVLLALIGKQWLSLSDAAGRRRLDDPGDFVRLEVATALRRDVRVIPLLVHGAKMPSGQALPPDLEPLARRNAAEITDTNFHRDVDGLLRAMQGVFAADEPAGARPVVGQIVVGHPDGQYNLHVGSVHGGVLHNVATGEAARLKPRPTPILVRPRPFPGILDREAEILTAAKAIRDGLPVQFYGEEGIGKTSILRRLAHDPQGEAFPDGLLYFSARGKPTGDLLEELFEAFFEANPLYKPADAEIRQSLQGKKALILLDDADVTKQEIEDLMNAAPGCVFLTTSAARTLWGEGRAIGLKGLPEDFCVALLEREIGRPISGKERSAALEACGSLGGNPLQLLHVAAAVTDEAISVTAAASRQKEDPPGAMSALSGRPPQQRRLLSALAALGGESVDPQHLAALAGENDAAADLEALSRSGLVRYEGGRYRLARNLFSVIRQTSDFAVSLDRALDYFAEWAEQSGEETERIHAETGSVSGLLESAAASGKWKKVLRLARAADGALALSKRWGSWEKILHRQLDAARALGDTAGEARASHQLGTCRLCLGDAALAKKYLGRAIELREAIGDAEGAALSRHNLEQFAPAPSAQQERSEQAKRAARAPSGLLLKGAAALSLLAIPAVIYYTMTDRRQPATVEKAAPTPAPVPRPAERAAPSEPPAPARPKSVVEEAAKPTPLAAPTPQSIQPIEPVAQQPTEALWVRPTSLTFSSLEVTTETSAQESPGEGGTRILRRRSMQTEERRVSVFSQSTAAVKITGTNIIGPNASDFTRTDDSCSNRELEPEARCTVSIQFAPAASGARSATLRIEYSGSGSPKLVNLSGAGAASRPE